MANAAKITAMRQNTAFALACGVTAFLLVGGSAIVTNWRSSTAAADTFVASVTAPAALAASAAPTSDPAMQERAVFLAREAVYQHRLAEANQRIAEADQKLAAASATIAASDAAAPTAVAEQASVEQPADQPVAAVQPLPQPRTKAKQKQRPQQITAEKAGLIALAAGSAKGAASVQRNELVLFQGVAAYEVVLGNGVVYVDAASGAVLFSAWTPPPAPTTDPAPASGDVAAVPPSAPAPAPAPEPAPAVDAPPPASQDDDQHDEQHDDEHQQEEEHDDD